jgi:hypothetical protein
MAKRAPILPENYNPVGERLKRVVEPTPETPANIDEKVIELTRPIVAAVAAAVPELSPPQALVEEKEIIPEIPTDKELKDASVKFRCTPSERKKWHEITQEITGEHNQLSHIIRATLILVENSYEQLKRVSPEMQRLKNPPKTDSLATALYEQRLAQLLFDAIKATGRPRG